MAAVNLPTLVNRGVSGTAFKSVKVKLLEQSVRRNGCCPASTFTSTPQEKNQPPSATKGMSTMPGQEPELGISLKTEIPGPKTLALKEDLMQLQQASSMVLASDFNKCKGVYYVDADGNSYLDAFMQIGSIPLGYNHPAILSSLSNPQNLSTLANRPSAAFFPGTDWTKRIRESFMSIAPPGHDHIYTMMCGSCSNENAVKMMFMRYMEKQRGGRAEFTKEELDTTMENRPPGIPKLAVLSFKRGFHGRTLGLLSCSNSRPIHSIDIPAYDFPKAEFPLYKYPLEEHVRENAEEDRKCLASVEEEIEKQEKLGVPVAGIIVEPIQCEGGDNHGSKEFFQGLEKIAKKYDISLAFDEVQTGGGSSGKMWCHEHFDMEHGPDLVTFAKKMLSGGVYHKKSHRPSLPGRVQNTWLGDPHKLVMLPEVVKTIKSENLLDNMTNTGEVTLAGFKELERKFPQYLHASRGIGCMLAVDCPSEQIRDKIVVGMRKKGVLIGGCGEAAIRLRPSLTFRPHHAELLLSVMEDVLKEM